MTSDRGDDFVNGEDASVRNGDSSEGAERNENLRLVVGENVEEEFVSYDLMEKGDVDVEDDSVSKVDSIVEDVETNENGERIRDLGMWNEMSISIQEEKEVIRNSELKEDQNRDENEEFVGGDSLLDRVDRVVETKGKLGLATHETEPSFLDEEGQKVKVKKGESLGNEEKSDHRIHHGFLLQEKYKTGFSINDLVWGKVKGHPWWPGQIFDPKYASEMALKCQKNDCFLVAYFGDNTFAWVPESQLKPFRAYFLTLEKQSSMVPFVNAVSVILEEVTTQVELGMACPCLGDEAYDNLKYQKLENAGIQNGTRRAVVDGSVFANAFRSKSILGYLRALAQCPLGVFDRLELKIATAQLKVFYHWKGCPQLPVFVYGGGLVENDAEISLANTKMSGKGSKNNIHEKEPVSKGHKRKGVSQRKEQRKKIKPNDRQEVEGRRIVSGLEGIKEETPTALILCFSESDAIPSVADLIKIFSPYGPLREEETEILKKTGRSKVIFRYRDDAERAFSSAGKYSIFGPALVSYRLRYSL